MKGTLKSGRQNSRANESQLCDRVLGLGEPRLEVQRRKQNGFLRWPNWIALGLVRLYQKSLSPVLHVSLPYLLGSPGLQWGCRYAVSCSEYSAQVFQRESFFRALFMSMRRLVSCHPWSRSTREFFRE